MGIYDKSAVIVVSDHGDQFYEHGSVGHGDTVYQELVHVPLIIRAPGRVPAGRVVHADVEVMDVYATLLDLAGLQARRRTSQGTSLVAAGARRGGRQPARRADRRRPGVARAQGAALPHGPPRPGAHRALRRDTTIRASRRTSPPTGRSRCAGCAACSACCTRTRTPGQGALGNGGQRQRGVLRGRRGARPARRRAEIGRAEVTPVAAPAAPGEVRSARNSGIVNQMTLVRPALVIALLALLGCMTTDRDGRGTATRPPPAAVDGSQRMRPRRWERFHCRFSWR